MRRTRKVYLGTRTTESQALNLKVSSSNTPKAHVGQVLAEMQTIEISLLKMLRADGGLLLRARECTAYSMLLR